MRIDWSLVAGNWPFPGPALVPGLYLQGAYGIMLIPPGMVPVAGWNPYQITNLRDVSDEITQLKNQYATMAAYMKSAGHPLPPSPNGAGNGDGDHTPSLMGTMDG
ncbi:hypothetical protein RHMOL_Rhmol03G0177200 [Rhododendron molle]|uniref:Uncharacterized protein n=1 Tax=Rhododendron molle TaxID=49168 RepID=A0ACC0PFB0_RHOML|nr:hypothetical protein RHMOL_Rhmol03G0177200 [Rhododendron molle]